MELTDADQIRAALADNDAQPHGPARCAVAEELVAAADALGDQGLLVTALSELMQAYDRGGEQAKAPVPFARLLRLLDENPESFSPYELYRTRWYFKWVTSCLIDIPAASLASINGWVREMERRYKSAGFSMRTVAAQDLKVYLHIGDTPRAEAERIVMLDLPRDQMSDCAACEAHWLGRVHIVAGRYQDALATWSDVLSGQLTCVEEPHVTLAASLMPLLHLGKTGDAKSNHLRGYHLARGNVSLARAIGEHMEFCALTGNEGRGVEILAENWPMLTAVSDPLSRLDFLTGVAVLLRRLTAVGYSNIPVYSETAGGLLARIMPEITDLATRFDARNGTTGVSDQMNQRLDRPPLLDQLALRGLPAAAPAGYREPVPAGSPDDLAGLVARARDLDQVGHPDVRGAWDRVQALAADADIDDLLAGDLAENQAFASARDDDWPAVVAGLRAASQHFEAAGQLGRVAAATARTVWAMAQQHPDSDPWPELDSQLVRAQELLGAGQAEPRDLLAVRHARASVAAVALEHGADRDRDGLSARLVAEAEALIADARKHDNLAREAVGETLLSRVSSLTGDLNEETAHLQEAVRLLDQAGRPWATPRLKARLGEIMLGRAESAAAAPLLEEAITAATQWPENGFPSGVAHMMLAHAYRLQDQRELALLNARIGLARIDQAGDALGAAQARADLGLILASADRLDEAITMLTNAIPQLADLAADHAAASARVTLGQVLRQTGDHLGAAQQFALAANTFGAGPDQHAHLFASAEAALSLAQGGMWKEAHRAYDHALALGTSLGHWPALVKMHRELAQVATRDGRADGPGRALHHIDQALAAGEQAYAIADGAETAGGEPCDGQPPSGENRDLVRERGITCHEAGRALAHAQRYEDALAWLERGIADLETDDDNIDELARATYLAASLEGTELGRAEQARDRLRAIIGRCTQLGRDDATAELTRLSAELEQRR